MPSLLVLFLPRPCLLSFPFSLPPALPSVLSNGLFHSLRLHISCARLPAPTRASAWNLIVFNYVVFTLKMLSVKHTNTIIRVLYPTCQSFSHHIYLKCWHSAGARIWKIWRCGYTFGVMWSLYRPSICKHSNVFCIVLYFTQTHTQKYV